MRALPMREKRRKSRIWRIFRSFNTEERAVWE